MNRVIVTSDEEYINHLLAANKSQSDFIRQLQEERDVACGANSDYCDEIERLREKLRVAEEALVKCRYRSLCDEVVDEALAKIREVK